MSVHRFTLDVDVDDRALQAHLDGPNAKVRPPYGAPSTWDARDLGDCIGMEIIDLSESELIYEGKVS